MVVFSLHSIVFIWWNCWNQMVCSTDRCSSKSRKGFRRDLSKKNHPCNYWGNSLTMSKCLQSMTVSHRLEMNSTTPVMFSLSYVEEHCFLLLIILVFPDCSYYYNLISSFQLLWCKLCGHEKRCCHLPGAAISSLYCIFVRNISFLTCLTEASTLTLGVPVYPRRWLWQTGSD